MPAWRPSISRWIPSRTGRKLPKALEPIRRYFDYLIKKQYVYDFSVFFNINITRINLEDVRQLTEIAHDVGIATDYHINESPMLEQPHFKHNDGNSTFIAPEDWPRVDAVVDWLIAEEPVRLQDGELRPAAARNEGVHARQTPGMGLPGGQNSLIIRTDGTLAPCFPMYNAAHNWGVVGQPCFDRRQLRI